MTRKVQKHHMPIKLCKRTIFCAAFFLFAHSNSLADTTLDANRAIQEANTRILRSLMANDMSKYFSLLHPDYNEVDKQGNSNNRAHSKESKIRYLSQWQLTQSSFSFTSVQMRNSNEAVVFESDRLIWKSRSNPAHQTLILAGYRRTWVKSHTGWLLRSTRVLTEETVKQ